MNLRRAAVGLLAVPLLLGSCAGTPRGAPSPFDPSRWSGDPVVRTRFGEVRGHEDADGTWAWKGIPYAAAPVGDLRWRAPVEPEPWDGVRDADRFGAAALQRRPLFGGMTGSEDCLYLNVWRPRDDEDRLPVYVWIHGGGNSIGSSSIVPDYRGNRLAARSRVVFVSVNYRLGPLGWFALPALRDGRSPEDDSGNYGTLDLVQALRWIRQNIAAFGGDPGTVLISGESAGGMNVLSLIASPLATGLFHRALVQSGVARTSTREEAEARAEQTLLLLLERDRRARSEEEAARVAAAMSAEEVRAYLRAQGGRRLLSCYPAGAFGMVDNPSLIRDGAVLPAAGFLAWGAGPPASRVPMVIGTNRDEIKIFMAFDRTQDWRSPVYRASAQYASDRWKAGSVDAVARRLVASPGQPPVYAYRFDWGSPGPDGASVLPGAWGTRLGAFHSLEIPFFLGTDTVNGVMGWTLFTRKNEPGRRALSDLMMRYLARFIRTGDPNGEGLPRWVPWANGLGAPKCLLLDAGLDAVRIGQTAEEYTPESVEATLREAFPGEVVGVVLSRPQLIRVDFEE